MSPLRRPGPLIPLIFFLMQLSPAVNINSVIIFNHLSGYRYAAYEERIIACAFGVTNKPEHAPYMTTCPEG
jgi:hypothetical protein